MVVKIIPEKVAPAAIKDEKPPMNSAMTNFGDWEWVISAKR